MTRIETQGGADYINVYRTSGALALEAGGGQNVITVGSNAQGLGPINGAVSANGGGTSTFLVNDAVTRATQSMPSYEYVVDADVVQRIDKAAITYQNMANLTLYTSQATDIVTIRGTAPFAEGSAGTVIGTARGDDFVTIRGTNGYLRVDLGDDVGRVSAGDTTNSLDAIRGRVDLAGAGFDVVISNEASTTAQSANYSQSE